MRAQLSTLAERNGGVFRRRDALAAGYTAGEIRHRLDSGRWCVLRPGVYAEPLADARRHHVLHVRARLLTMPDAVASHTSAAVLQGVLPAADAPARAQVTRKPAPRRSPQRDVAIAALPGAHLTRRYGVLLTAPARTVLDLLRTQPVHAAAALADAALRDERTHVAALRDVADDCASWPGIGQARELVEFADGRAETALESVSRWELHRCDVEAPELQVWLSDLDGRSHRVDFYWRRYRVIGEADGLLKYTDATVLRAEKRRQERLEQAGFVVVRWTWAEITTAPETVAARILRAFSRAA